MSGIFISYRRDDSAGYAGWLADDLRDRFPPELIFMDVTGIAPGMDFRAVIEEKVGACDALLAIIGKSWLAASGPENQSRLQDPRDLVRHEVAVALQRGIPVIPVLVDGAGMPAATALPPGLESLAWRNAVELRHARWAADVQALLAALETILPHRMARPHQAPDTFDTLPSPPAATTSHRPGNRHRWSMLAVTSAGVLVTLAILLSWLWREDPSPGAALRQTDSNPLEGSLDPRPSQERPATAPGDGKYPATLPAATQVTVGSASYQILAARVERLNPGTLALIFGMRMTSNRGNGDNFWSDSFRLIVDGVPRASVNSLNEVVEGYSARDGEVVFEIDPAATAAQLQISHYNESTTIPIDLTAAVPGIPSLPALPKLDGPFPVTLAAGAEVKDGAAVYRILSARLERYNMEKLALKLSVRMTNMEKYGASFWDSSFRLLVDGVPRAPVSFLNEIVEGNSAKDGEVVFVFDDTVQTLTLLVGRGKEKSKVPIDLKTGKTQ